MGAQERISKDRVLNGLSFLPAWWASGVVLLLALMLGGGTRQGLLSDAVVQLASLPLLGTALFQVAKSEMNGQRRAALWLLAAVALLPILQLLPMPPAIWPLLPGRSAFASAYAEAAMPVPWLGISLSPPATWRSALALVPPVAIFLSVLMLGRRARRALTIGLIAFGFVSVLLGLAQVAQGPESGLRFYAVTNLTESVGFFANRNHFAALLYFVLPFTAAWAVGLAADRRPEMLVGVSLCLLVFASLLLGLGVSRSRGGLALAMLGGAGSLALAWTGQGALATKRASRFVFVGGLVGAFLILQFASLGILQRLETDIADDLRWELTSVTAGIAIKFQPFGSGIGTFDPIYRMFEEAERLRAVYANHAHNDYVELLLEGGLPAIILILAFFGWLAHASVQVWRRPSSGHDSAIDVSLPRAATIAALLICIHSAVDYPLRTTTLSTLFAFACALAIPPIRGRSGNGSGETRDSGRSSSHRRRRSTSRPVAAGAEPRASLRGAPD